MKGKKVFVGLSGGVDSAVSAALLQRAGAEVTGVFIKGWYPQGMPCTWSEDRRDAMRAAAHLHIPFHTLDASVEYKQGVIDYLLREYALGRTPNPDVMCNREVKFGAFWRFAMEHEADFIATGHYLQNVDGNSMCGLDDAKDQSYFLWAVPRAALAKTLFPVGALAKTETRRLARKFGIPQADKKDSQGICFLGSISVDDFLRSEIGATPGKALDTQGAVVGEHSGAVLATLGERVALQSALPGPWYVLAKDMKSNVLTVGHTIAPSLRTEGVALREANWIQPLPHTGLIHAQYRYHGPRVEGTLNAEGTLFLSSAQQGEVAVPGQSLVCYRGRTLLGGGIIA